MSNTYNDTSEKIRGSESRISYSGDASAGHGLIAIAHAINGAAKQIAEALQK